MGKKKLKFLIGGLVIVGAIASLAFFAVRQNMVYYYTVDEVMAKGPTQNIKVSGYLVRGSIQKGAKLGDPIVFKLRDKNKPNEIMLVSHTGNVPDTFREPRQDEPDPEVIATGDYLSNGTFSSVELLAKCPSKYEAAAKSNTTTSGK